MKKIKAVGIIEIERPKQETRKVACPVCGQKISLSDPERYQHLIFFRRGRRIVCPKRVVRILKD